MMKKNTCISIICIFTAVLLLGAWGENVELLDDKKKLIDLDNAIEFARPGGGSATQQEGDTEGKPPEEAAGGDTNIPVTNVIEITIQGRTVYYNGKELGSDSFVNKLTDDNAKGRTFVLVDDYADASVYKNVRKTMREQKEKNGLEFAEKMSEEE